MENGVEREIFVIKPAAFLFSANPPYNSEVEAYTLVFFVKPKIRRPQYS
jgi:hypothetical protein